MKQELPFSSSSRWLFEQVYEYLLNRIQRKEWQAHDKLPSVRRLAQNLSVHQLTVFKAYQLLKQNGYVYVKDKSGYYVHPGQSLPFENLDSPIISSYVHQSHLSEIHRVPVTYQFSCALIDPNLLPNRYFSEYAKEIIDLYPKLLGTYSTVQGDEELRDCLAQYFNCIHQFHVTADDLCIASGAQQAIDLVAKILVKPMDTILLERPTYSAAIDIFRQRGAQIIPIDIHPYGYDLAQVETYMKDHKPRLFYLNPTFHNPTGYTIPTPQRKRLVELAEQYHCFLVEDDVFHDIYFEEAPPPSLFSYDTEGYVMYIHSFSKYIAPGLRIAAVVSRPALMKHLVAAKSLTDNGSPLLNQKLFLHYFSSQRLQQHIAKLRTALNIRKTIMEDELAPTNWEWISPQGGLNLWVTLPATVPMEVLLAKSIQHSISFVPGTICDPLHEPSSKIRLSYSFVNEQQLREGIRQLIQLSQQILN